MVRQMGLEPIRRRHTPLKRACLPIPALPHTIQLAVLLTASLLYHRVSQLSSLIFNFFIIIVKCFNSCYNQANVIA